MLKAPTKAPTTNPFSDTQAIVPTNEYPSAAPTMQPMPSPIIQPRRSRRLQQTNIISQDTINFITHQVYLEETHLYALDSFYPEQPDGITMPDLEHFAGAGVVYIPKRVKPSPSIELWPAIQPQEIFGPELLVKSSEF